ncbi:MAG: ribonuclease HI family protein [Methanomassiliicoccales archaeon]|jgi:ribonuclease HI|nr:ribonuclease HI family protein [Methanomassiliicoccales archaeon]
MTIHLAIYTDGGSRGNPGPAAYAVIIVDERGTVVKEFSRFIQTATNNEAEYRGLIAGLEEASRLGADEVDIFMDSELVVNQINGKYAIKASNLIPLAKEVFSKLRNFKRCSIRHVSRNNPMTSRADMLLNSELDNHTGN